MKKLNIRNKEIHLLVLFGLFTLLFISVNFANNYTPHGNTIIDNKLPRSADISITIVTPTTNENFSSTPPDFEVEVNETANPMWYTIDNGVTNITFSINTTIDQGNWTALSDGPVTLTFYFNDSLSQIFTSSVDINKDTVTPSIDSIDSPLTNSNHSAPPSYGLTITEANPDSVWYTLDGGTNNYTGAPSGTIDSTPWSNAGQGSVTITFYANDSAGNWNSAPVGVNKDTVTPSIDSIVSPLPNSNHSAPPSYNLIITETNLDSVWYTLDGGTNNYTGATSGTIASTPWSNAGQGPVTITFYANDSIGSWDTASVVINKDSINPSIDSIVSPLPSSNHSTPPSYSLTITEANLESIWYTLDGGTNNYTGATSGTIDSTPWSNAGEGAVTITFYLNDSAGNWNSATVGVNKDTTAPQINIVSPLSGQTFGVEAPSLIVEIDDGTLHTMWYNLNGGVNITFVNNGTIDQNNWTALLIGPVTLTFFANDTFGHFNSTSVNFNKNAEAFLLSPLGLTIIGVAIAIVVIVILIKRRGHHKTSNKEVKRISGLWG